MPAPSMRERSAANLPDGRAVSRFIRRHPLVSFLLWACTLEQVLPWSVVLTGIGGCRDRYWSAPSLTPPCS